MSSAQDQVRLLEGLDTRELIREGAATKPYGHDKQQAGACYSTMRLIALVKAQVRPAEQIRPREALAGELK